MQVEVAFTEVRNKEQVQGKWIDTSVTTVPDGKVQVLAHCSIKKSINSDLIKPPKIYPLYSNRKRTERGGGGREEK